VQALESLKKVDYPADLFEILVAEGSQPSKQRNRAAAVASGDIIYFLDDDSMVAPDFLRRTERHYADPAVAAVGGPSLTPKTDTLLQKAHGLSLASLFGGGGVRNRYRQTGATRATGDHELILCNLSIRREVFLEFGGLDERLYPNEENELMERILRTGLLLIHDPELAVYRSQRPTFRAFIRQLFTYGRGRAEQTLISGKPHFVNFIPALFLIYVSLLPVADKPVYYLPLLCYGILDTFFALFESSNGGTVRALPLLLVIFPALHLAYGAGVMWGLVSPRSRRSSFGCGEVTVKRQEAVNSRQ
jgi:GT2 family glycosyltransferase